MQGKNFEECKATFPTDTVFIWAVSDKLLIQPWDKYAKKGHTFEECLEAAKKEPEFWEVRQDATLYRAVKERCEAMEGGFESLFSDIFNALLSIEDRLTELRHFYRRWLI